MERVLVQEIPASVDLVLVQLRDEVQVDLGCLAGGGTLPFVRVACFVEPLPGAELFTLR